MLGDHGVKAQGDGWLLTVTLIEGTNLAATKSSGYSDPYVVFTCNGKTKTSSIKFQEGARRARFAGAGDSGGRWTVWPLVSNRLAGFW